MLKGEIIKTEIIILEKNFLYRDNASMQNQSYKFPVILAIVLHSVLFIALFIHWLPKMHLGQGQEIQIVNATLIQTHASQGIKSPVSLTKPVIIKPKRVQEKIIKPTPKIEPKSLEQPKPIEKSKPIEKPKLATPKITPKVEPKAEKIPPKKTETVNSVEKQQMQKHLQAEQQRLMQQQLAQEEKQLSAAASSLANDQKLQSELDKYKALIVQTISQNWLVPDNVDKHISCELLISVGPGGSVLNVQIVRSSGNTQLDQSASEAVFKSSPLPVPNDPELFDKFRTLRLTVKPQSVVTPPS